jgi:hypothetical protein
MTRDDARRLALEVEHRMLTAGWPVDACVAAFVSVQSATTDGDKAGWLTLFEFDRTPS